jgi:sulfur carrier protein
VTNERHGFDLDVRGERWRHSLAGMNAVRVTVNGDPHQVDAGSTVVDVVRRWARSETGVAVAVNDTVVRRAEWPDTPIADGDRVEILTAVQGG